VGTKYLRVSVATGACQRASSHHAIYMDIAVSDKFRTGTHMICNNKITVWRINALTGTYRLINQTRFCDLD
jgi:hypothetical protein